MSPTNGITNGSLSNGTSTPIDPTSLHRPTDSIKVTSPNVNYTTSSEQKEYIESKYVHHGAEVVTTFTTTPGEGNGEEGKKYEVKPTEKVWEFRTERKVPKTGLMLVGWGGNNGSTLTATILANKHNLSWGHKEGTRNPNYLGSLVRASTVRLGVDPETQKDVYVPFSDLLPMVHPNDLVIGGWDISKLSIDQAIERSKVLDYDLQQKVKPFVKDLKPLPSIYYSDFIAANQGERADNLYPSCQDGKGGSDKWGDVERVMKDVKEFKEKKGLDKVVVLWTANTERYADLIPGVNDTKENLIKAIKENHPEVAPSTIFAVACILLSSSDPTFSLGSSVPFINGAPQNTFVPGCIDLAIHHQAFIGGDDFKSGQTKIKSVLAEFLVNAGIKPKSIASYNHLGNNDGWNLSAERQFRSKEISKSSVVDDMVASNPLLYKPLPESPEGEKAIVQGKKQRKTEHPDHIVVIKYVPAAGDTKKAIDEYQSEIMMHGTNTINIFNMCEDSLLATPLILDLTILAELLTRINYRGDGQKDWDGLHSVMGLLSYMCKAPLTKPGEDVVNSLGRQRNALEAFLKACIGLQPGNDMMNFTYLNQMESEKGRAK